MNNLCRTLLAGSLLATALGTQAQGLEGIIVEDYYTISAADADYLNNTVGVTYPIVTGAKVYRIYVDMAPGYRLNTVNGSPAVGGPSPNPLDFTTTTTFWNEDGFGSEVPPQSARLDDGAAFDSYITIGVTGRSGGAVGCGSNVQNQGVLKTADTNGNLTLCSVYEGFPSGAGTPDGNIPTSPAIPALTYNLGGLIDFAALTADGNQLVVVGDAWATLPNGTGVDPTGTNRVLIAQLTTDGQLSFHLNVQLQQPTGGVLETYVWNQAGAGEVVSSLLTYPSACTPAAIVSTSSNSPICSNATLNLGVVASGTEPINYTWTGAGTISNGNAANASVTGAASGNYNIAVSNACGNANQNVAVIVTSVTTNTTTASACDSYTWAVNGQTYTASGTYTSVSGCATETLVLTITPSTNNTTTASACDSYTWAVNGQTYTASGTYTSVTGCSTETLVLTITPSTNNTTTASACDSYTWSVNGQTYTASGTYTSVTGCNTETLVLTIITSGNNTTTASACDSYTWAVNGQTYTASGTYTSVTGCSTETLVLTITPSTNNTTTASACDSYTWSVNGQTYTASGTYTATTGCSTETLVLTITPSTSNTTTASACDSYTWSVNGQTYTASGTYTSVDGCHTETLVLTIITSGNNTTTASACDSYTWAVNGQTYTASGTYTATTGCSTETLVLTITPSTTNSTTIIACSSYVWSVNGQTYTTSGTYTALSGCSTETLVLTINVPGTACDDGNPNTFPDLLNATCQCVGTPIGGCTENLTLDIKLDGNPAQTTWALYDETETTVLVSGGPFSAGQANTTVTENICVPQGCYHLRVLDSGNNGITNGGYILRDAQSRRIIDASKGSFAGVSEINNVSSPNRLICLPIGSIKLQNAYCDRSSSPIHGPITCNSQPGATGYQFWIYDPHGSYNRRVLVNTNTLVPGNLVTTPVPTNIFLNVRVRSLTNGVYSKFGPACTIRFTGTSSNFADQRILADENNEVVSQFGLYPNPSRDGQFTITLVGLENIDATPVSVEVFDMLGQRIVAEQTTTADGALNHHVDLNGRAQAGMYLVHVTIEGRVFTQRLVLQ